MTAKALNYYVIEGAIDNAPDCPEGATPWNTSYINHYVLKSKSIITVYDEVQELQLEHDVAYQQKNPNFTEIILSPNGSKPKYLENLKVKMLVTNNETGEEHEEFYKLKLSPIKHIVNGKLVN